MAAHRWTLSRRSLRTRQLRLEALEERSLMAVFAVNTVADAIDVSPGNGLCDTASGQCSLRAAIMETNALTGADEINLPAGSYRLALPGVWEDVAAEGDLDVTDDLTILGEDPANTIVNGTIDDRNFDVRSGTVTFDRMTIRGGNGWGSIYGYDGGSAIAIRNQAVMYLKNSRISQNGNSIYFPSAIYNSGILSISSSTIADNAGIYGGGITNVGVLSIVNSSIHGNTAMTGGGIANFGSMSASSITVSGNTAIGGQLHPMHPIVPAFGGGILNYYGGTIDLVNSTVTGNVAQSGGGIMNSPNSPASSFTIAGSIVASNSNGDIFGEFTTQGSNLIGDGTGGSGFGSGDLVGSHTIPIDPRLGPLQDNGGPTFTHMPAADSPALDSGDPNFVPPSFFDQRGAPYRRLQDGNGDGIRRIDIGAVEVQSSALSNDGDFNDDGVYDLLDIDELVARIAAGITSEAHDLNGDGHVDLADRDWWLGEAGEANLGFGQVYLLGDANLDGAVDGSDFGIWNAHKFTAVAAWSQGDFTADGMVDGSDFGHWNANKFTSSDGDNLARMHSLNVRALQRAAEPEEQFWSTLDCQMQNDERKMQVGELQYSTLPFWSP